MPSPHLPNIHPRIFHLYLAHGLLRVAQFWKPDVKPWEADTFENAPEEDKQRIYQYLKMYLAPNLYKLSLDDLSGVCIALRGDFPEETNEFSKHVKHTLLTMTKNFWLDLDVPDIQYGIFRDEPDPDSMPYTFEGIVYESLSVLVYQIQKVFSIDLDLYEFHDKCGDYQTSKGILMSILTEIFHDTFSQEVLLVAQVGANELSSFYSQPPVFGIDEESDQYRLWYCLKMAQDHVSEFVD
jgi:hypothetical protein